jgi:ech hydrogenase subunit F
MAKMVPVVLKNLFSRPATRRYPFEVREPFARTRGRLEWDLSLCDFCGDCQRICPSAAIEVCKEAKEVVYNPFRCIYCHLCAEGCWKAAIKAFNVYTKPSYTKETVSFTASPQG